MLLFATQWPSFIIIIIVLLNAYHTPLPLFRNSGYPPFIKFKTYKTYTITNHLRAFFYVGHALFSKSIAQRVYLVSIWHTFMTKATLPSQVSACVFNQHDGHKCMSLYIEKKIVCYVLLVCIRHMSLPSTKRIGFYTLWKDTVCIYHYFTIGYMHINCDFTLNKRRWITIYTLWDGMYNFIKGYTHISYSITQRRIIDACFTESDFNFNKWRRIVFYTLWYVYILLWIYTFHTHLNQNHVHLQYTLLSTLLINWYCRRSDSIQNDLTGFTWRTQPERSLACVASFVIINKTTCVCNVNIVIKNIIDLPSSAKLRNQNIS